MIEVLAKTSTGTCRNCGRPITRLTANASDGEWKHDPDPGRGIYRRECFNAPVAEPSDEAEVSHA